MMIRPLKYRNPLHKLDGISNQKEIIYNVNRLYLLIDTIADLYTISKYDEYFKLSFYADFNDKDFQLRWKYYKLICMERLQLTNINLIEYCLNNKTNESKKNTMISILDEKIELITTIRNKNDITRI